MNYERQEQEILSVLNQRQRNMMNKKNFKINQIKKENLQMAQMRKRSSVDHANKERDRQRMELKKIENLGKPIEYIPK